MKPKILAIPTRYRGITFRSRLEATWAAFMDVVGWRWGYEPYELAGYIPDFIVEFTRQSLLVEVEPETRLAALADHRHRIEASGWPHEALIVGAGPFLDGGLLHANPVLGLLAERDDHIEPSEWLWEPGVVSYHEGLTGGCLGLHSDVHSYRCRVCGWYDGYVPAEGRIELEEAWGEAKRARQWRPA